MLHAVSSKSLPGALLAPVVVEWCPTMDLLIMVAGLLTVLAYRMGEQRVYAVHNGAEVTLVLWRRDGRAMAIGGGDGLCKVYDTNSGRLVARLGSGSTAVANVTWCAGESEAEVVPLAGGDIIAMLPPLPPLLAPKGSALGALLAYDADLLGVLQRAGAIDLLFVWFADCAVDVTLYGLLTVPRVPVPAPGTVLRHCHSPTLEHHHVLCLHDGALVLMPVVVPYISQPGLHEVAHTLSQILAVLGYLREIIAGLGSSLLVLLAWGARHLDAIRAEGDNDPAALLMDALLTGMMLAGVQLWLEPMEPRETAKLLATETAGYEALRTTLLTSVIPAVERLVVHLLALGGWARGRLAGNPFGLVPLVIEQCVAGLTALLARANACVWQLNDETTAFGHFGEWLLQMCVEMGRDGGEGEPPEPPPTRSVLHYLKHHMVQLPLEQMLHGGSDSLQQMVETVARLCDGVFEEVKLALRTQMQFLPPVVLLTVDATDGRQVVQDMRVVGGSVYVACVVRGGVLALHRYATGVVEQAVVEAVDGGEWSAVLFADDSELIAVCHEDGARQSHVVRVPFVEVAYGGSVAWALLASAAVPHRPPARKAKEGLRDGSTPSVAPATALRPVAMAVNGREHHRVVALVGDTLQKCAVWRLA